MADGRSQCHVRGRPRRDATADVLVAELRQVIADLRRGQDDLRQERDKWQVAHEREQAAHAATQRLLLPPPATAQSFAGLSFLLGRRGIARGYPRIEYGRDQPPHH